ncbi:hypothetical protein AJ79_03580 [Helicocarpus griseus UAMH5409]|uniref:Uncharacterized protein n=1 Tax=Helicocarpus griseus UAMH5409 TaxID=1447875 RepID=A0A2B7XYN9_9EURO|nr:hypothetical protein AJ79_03580 [Helicocarpus griseus UAMH5409]
MLDSPAKRRKSNSSSAIAVNASNTAQQPRGTNGNEIPPPRPNRASFQSPTRASLARSHPDVLSRVLSRSPPKTAQPRPSSRGRQSGTFVGNDGRPGIRASKLPRPSSLSAAATELPIRQANPKLAPGSRLSPRRESSVPVSSVSGRRIQSQRPRVSYSAEPGAELTASAPITRPEGDYVDDQGPQLDSGSGRGTEGTLINGRHTRSSSSTEQQNGEPELPPTPTELGLERVPNRSRGLLSSSSPSYRQEKKKKQRLRDGLKRPSPLKPRDAQRPAGEDHQDNIVSPRISFPEEDVPDELGEKQKLRDALAAQLARLKDDIAKIEYETQRYERPDEYPAPDEESMNNLIELLTTSNPSCIPPPPAPPSPPPISSLLSFLLPFSSDRFIPTVEPSPRSPSPPPENPFALQQPADLTPYLTLFAPLSLTTHTTTTSSTSEKHLPSLTQTHTLTLSAPAPFPPHLFQVPITFQTNPETQTVLSISSPPQNQTPISNNSSPNLPTPLSTWLQTRVSNPLLQRDISGLCWGVSRYWEADVSRAEAWARLEELREQIMQGKYPPEGESSSNNRKTYSPGTLLPHLGRTSLLFSAGLQKGRHSSVQLLVSCPLTLDVWTSEPQLQPDISVSVSSLAAADAEKVEKKAKGVFRGFLKTGNGSGGGHGRVEIEGDAEVLVRAVEGVVGVCFGVE